MRGRRRVLLLRASYLEDPLRERTPGCADAEIGIEELVGELGVTAELAARLEAWNAAYARAAEAAPDAVWAREFSAAGAALADALRRELGEGVEVQYVDGFHGTPAGDAPPRTGRAPDGDYRWSALRPGEGG